MISKESISVVIPTLNEAENIPALFNRIDKTLSKAKIPYEIIVIDDHSDDNTVKVVTELSKEYDARVILKDGEPGKAFSLLQGFREARNPLICMIDADLQYPPEAITPMYRLLTTKNADVVVSERNDNDTSALRKLSSFTFNFVFVRLLFGITYDTQSGLKLFRKRILNDFTLKPSAWSFDLEFLVRSLENKRKILSHQIKFAERTAGVTKVKLLSATTELAKASVTLRWNSSLRKVREGHRVNTVFVKRVFPSIAIALLSTVLLVVHAPSASALSLTGVIDLPISLPINLPHSDGSTGGSEGTQSANQSQSSGTASGESSTSAVSTQTKGVQSAGKTSSASASNTNGASALASAKNPSDASLGSATANKPFSQYALGYPSGQLSAKNKQLLKLVLWTALVVGSICIVGAILMIMMKSNNKSISYPGK